MKAVSIMLNDTNATLMFGKSLANLCQCTTIIFLKGDLGAGKTTFSQGFLQQLGHEGYVKSPTYTIVEVYNTTPLPVFHFDLYRLSSAEELEFMGVRDYFMQPALILVEWPQCGEGILPSPDLVLTFSYYQQGRLVELVAESEYGEQLLTQFLVLTEGIPNEI